MVQGPIFTVGSSSADANDGVASRTARESAKDVRMAHSFYASHLPDSHRGGRVRSPADATAGEPARLQTDQPAKSSMIAPPVGMKAALSVPARLSIPANWNWPCR